MMSELAMPIEQEANTSPKLVTCVGCGLKSSTQHRFCGKCGGQLWDPCLACTEKNPVDVRFCARCGVELAAPLAEAIAQREQALAEACGKAERGRFLDALDILQQVATVDHSQLRELTAQIQQRITEYPQQRELAIASAKTAAEEVQSLLDQGNYPAAHRRLQQVPEPFQDQTLRQLLAEIQPRIEESNQLRTAVAKALRDRKLEGLLPQVKRLANLNPDDEKTAKLLAQLEERQQTTARQTAKKLTKTALTALAKCDYKTARAAVVRMPDAMPEPAVVKTVQAVKERLWLEEQLRTAPYVTPTLLSMAERFAKLQPQDKRAARLHSMLNQRWSQARRKNSHAPVPWVQAPARVHLGVPVDLLNFGNPFDDKQPLRRDWLVAHGLAMQALGKAEINVNLAPSRKRTGWRQLLPRKGSIKKAARAWGVDIGASCIKAVQLAVEGETLRVLQTVRLSHRGHPSTDQQADSNGNCNAEDQAPAALATVEQLLGKYDVTNQTVAINLPGTQTLGRFFDIPAPKPNKFDETVQYELRARIPLHEQEAVYDYHWTPIEATEEENTPRRRVTLVAANRGHVEDRLGGFQDAGVSQLLVQSECIALYNMVRHCLQTKPSEAQGLVDQGLVDQGLAVVEIGAQTTNWVVFTPSGVWFRGLYVGAAQLDQALVTSWQLTQKDAELLRRKPEQAPRMHEFHEQLVPEFASIAGAFHRTLNQVQQETKQSISQVLLCGGGAEQFGLLRYLQLGS